MTDQLQDPAWQQQESPEEPEWYTVICQECGDLIGTYDPLAEDHEMLCHWCSGEAEQA